MGGKKRGRKRKEEGGDAGGADGGVPLGELPEFQQAREAAAAAGGPSWEEGGGVGAGLRGEAAVDKELEEAMNDMNTGEGVWEFDEFNGYELEDVVEALAVFREGTGGFDVPVGYVVGEEGGEEEVPDGEEKGDSDIVKR